MLLSSQRGSLKNFHLSERAMHAWPGELILLLRQGRKGTEVRSDAPTNCLIFMLVLVSSRCTLLILYVQYIYCMFITVCVGYRACSEGCATWSDMTLAKP